MISGGTDIALRVGDNELVPVEVVGEDPSTDLAVLRADPAALDGSDPLRLADASKVFVGQPVVAIGIPFGLEGTVTAGIVSAKARVLQAPSAAIPASVEPDLGGHLLLVHCRAVSAQH